MYPFLQVYSNVTVEFIESIEWLPHSPKLNPLDYHVRDEFKQSMNKNETETFQSLEFLHQGTGSLASQNNIQSAIDQRKRLIHIVIQENIN
jgi:hypothetical protein